MQHTCEARRGVHGACHAARWSILAATVAIALALPGLARAQAPIEAAAPQAPPDAQAMPDASGTPVAPPATQAPVAGPGMQVPVAPPATQAPVTGPGMQALDVESPALPAPVPVDQKHVGFAIGGSLLATGAGLGAMIAGISSDNGALGLIGFTTALIGPSFGQFYAGEYGRGMTHVGVRAGAAAMTVGGAIWTIVGFFDCISFFGVQAECSAIHAGGPLLVLGGLGLGAGSIVKSIQEAPRAARRYNARARSRQIMIIPASMAGPDRTSGFGLQLGGQF